MTDPRPCRIPGRHSVASAPARAVRPLARLLLVALVLPFHIASAHVHLLHSVPAAGARVATAPHALTLTFNERVSEALFRLTLLDDANQVVAMDAPRVATNDAMTLTATLRGALRPGRYLVKWEAGGADGHPARGEFSFEIVAGAVGRSTSTVAPPQVRASLPSAFGVRSPGYVAIRAVQSVALVMLLGVLALHLLVLPRFIRQTGSDGVAMVAVIDRAANRWASAMLFAMGGATLARLAAQHAAFFAGTSWSRSTLGALLWNTNWGTAWWLAMGATGAGLLGSQWIRRARAQGWLVLGVAAIVLVVSIALSGHAAARTTLALLDHALHVLGAGGWVGSLAALMLVATPIVLRSSDGTNRHALVAEMVRAFSPTALAFAGLLAITGAIAAWRNLGGVAELWRSPYGQVLLAKLAVLSVVAATGAFNWKFVLPSLGSAATTSRLRRSATIELLAALLVLVVTAVLVATPMPAEMLPGGTP